MRLISFKAPASYLEGLDELVRIGIYSSRSEAIRVAIRDLIKKELNFEPQIQEEIFKMLTLESEKL